MYRIEQGGLAVEQRHQIATVGCIGDKLLVNVFNLQLVGHVLNMLGRFELQRNYLGQQLAGSAQLVGKVGRRVLVAYDHSPQPALHQN